MATSTFNIRMDENLKKTFDSLCEEFGMNATTAFNIFARAVVREKRIPFEIQSRTNIMTREIGKNAFFALRSETKEQGNQDWSQDQINQEIGNARHEVAE